MYDGCLECIHGLFKLCLNLCKLGFFIFRQVFFCCHFVILCLQCMESVPEDSGIRFCDLFLKAFLARIDLCLCKHLSGKSDLLFYLLRCHRHLKLGNGLLKSSANLIHFLLNGLCAVIDLICHLVDCKQCLPGFLCICAFLFSCHLI